MVKAPECPPPGYGPGRSPPNFLGNKMLIRCIRYVFGASHLKRNFQKKQVCKFAILFNKCAFWFHDYWDQFIWDHDIWNNIHLRPRHVFFRWNVSVIFLLRHFGHWNISVVCLTLVLKLAIAVFLAYVFKHSDRHDNFFRSFQKRFDLWPKNHRKKTVRNHIHLRSHSF